MQSRKQSFIETCTNTSIGMLGSWLITISVMSLVKDVWKASVITVFLCTVWSLVRGYIIRRSFAKKEVRNEEIGVSHRG